MKMIFKICLKRLRYSVYALFALTLCYHFAERWDSGALYSLFLFILLPLFVLALVWAVYTSIRDTARYKRSGVLPNDPPTLAERIVWFIQDEFSLVKSLTGRKKARFFAFRLLGFALIAAGCALMVSERIVWATLAIIAGIALIYSAAG